MTPHHFRLYLGRLSPSAERLVVNTKLRPTLGSSRFPEQADHLFLFRFRRFIGPRSPLFRVSETVCFWDFFLVRALFVSKGEPTKAM
jgi:hypothetical protein